MTTAMILLFISIALSTTASVIQYRMILQRERDASRIQQRLNWMAQRADH